MIDLNAIAAEHVDVCFGSHVIVEDFTHRFDPGCWTHIIGPNGAGKTTILKALAGIIPLSGGAVCIGGRNAAGLTYIERARAVAYVPQRLESLPNITVFDFVAQGMYALPQVRNDELERVIMRSLERLRIEHLASRTLDVLSGGELQLCVLASAIVQRARIILLDEPTSALDLRHIDIFTQTVQKLAADGTTVISVCHDLDLVAETADICVLIADGKCVCAVPKFPTAEQLCRTYQADPDVFKVPIRIAGERSAETVRGRNPDGGKSENVPEFCSPYVRPGRACAAAFGILAACLVLCPWLGASFVMPWDSAVHAEIFWQLRIPRVLWGAISGATLAMVGAAFQAMFQNPLASPYTLGVASGASLGAMAAIQFGAASLIGLPVLACFGGISMIFAVIFIASRFNMRSPVYCLLAGVAVSMFCSACGLIIQAFATPMTAQQMMRWQLGGLEIAGYGAFATVPVIAAGMAVLFILARPLSLMSVDADLAVSRGVNIVRTRLAALIAASIITSVVVSVCGPISFIGLIVPNALRHRLGADLRSILPVSAAVGAVSLVLADSVSRLLERFAWLPVGVIVALVGAPLFVWILFRSGRQGRE